MTNKRIRKKQELQRLMPGKTLEGYEKHLLQEIERHKKLSRSAPLSRPEMREDSRRLADMYEYMHKHLRKFYFDL